MSPVRFKRKIRLTMKIFDEAMREAGLVRRALKNNPEYRKWREKNIHHKRRRRK